MNTVIAQNLNPRIHSGIYFSDNNEVLGKCIFLLSTTPRNLIKQRSIGFLLSFGSEVKDTLLIQRVKKNGRCVFLKSSADTISVGLALRRKCKIMLFINDSNSGPLIKDTLQFKRLRAVGVKPNIDFAQVDYKGKVGINGSIQNETRFGTASYTSQELPNFYSRTQFAFGADAFGVPLKVNYFISTENGSKNDINNFQISVNVDELKRKLNQQKESLYSFKAPEVDLRKDINFSAKPSINSSLLPLKKIDKTFAEDSLTNKEDSLKSKLSYKKFEVDSFAYFQSSQRTISGLKSARFANPNFQINKYDSIQKIGRMKELLTLSKPDFSTPSSIRQLVKDSFIRTQGMLDARLKSRQTSYLSVLGSLKRLEVGNVILNYSPIWASGINIKGGSIGFENRGIEFNLFGGQQNRVISIDPREIGKRHIFGLQAGYFLSKYFKLSFAYLYGFDSKDSYNGIGANKISAYPEKNHVLNGGLNFSRKSHDVNIELSKSVNMDINSNRKFEFEGSSKKSLLLPGTAFQLKYKFQIPRLKTDVYNSYSYTNSEFNSFGLNFMRKEINKYDLKIRQIFFRQIQTTFGYTTTNTINSSISSVKMGNKTYSIQASVSLKRYLKRVTVMAIENNFKVGQYSDTTTANKQRLGSITLIWSIPINSSIKFNSAWNYCLSEISMDSKGTLNSTGTLSSSLKIKYFTLLNDISFIGNSDSLSQSQVQVAIAHEYKMFRGSLGCKLLWTNSAASNRNYFAQGDFVFRKTRAGFRYEFVDSISSKLDVSPTAITGGYILSIQLTQIF